MLNSCGHRHSPPALRRWSHLCLGLLVLTCVVPGPTSKAQEVWEQRLQRIDVNYPVLQRVNAQGEIYVAGTGVDASGNIVVHKYASEGTLLWSRTFATTSQEAPVAITLDPEGNLLITAYTFSYGTNSDYLTIKYSPDGVKRWHQRYNGSGHGADRPVGIATDSQGGIYVTGYSTGDTHGIVILTLKYDKDGTQQWVRRFYGSNGFDSPVGIAVDPADNIVVAGTSNTSDGANLITLKYSPDGLPLWYAHYSDPATAPYVNAAALAVDGSGGIYVAGRLSNATGSTVSDRLVKYSPEGRKVWERQPRAPLTAVSQLRTGPGDTIYVGGQAGIAALGVQKYSADNHLLFDRYHTEANTVSMGDLYVDGTGNAYVTGGVNRGAGHGIDCLTYRLDGTTGLSTWSRYFQAGNALEQIGRSVGVDEAGNVYVSGDAQAGAGSVYDLFTIKYTP